MGNILSTDVTYSVTKIKKLEDGRKIVNVTLAFGDSSKTYPAGGIPLLIGKMGCPTLVDSMSQVGNAGVAYVFQYDKANAKLIMLASTVTAAHTHTVPAHDHDLLVKGGQIASTTNDVATYAGPVLGKQAASDVTVVGSASAASGGVVGAAAGVSGSTGPTATALAEPSAVAIAAQSVNFEVIGY